MEIRDEHSTSINANCRATGKATMEPAMTKAYIQPPPYETRLVCDGHFMCRLHHEEVSMRNRRAPDETQSIEGV